MEHFGRHIEAHVVPEIEEAPRAPLRPQPGGRGALQSGHPTSTLSLTNRTSPLIKRSAYETRQILAKEYPGIDLTLPTVELFCDTYAQAIQLGVEIQQYLFEGRTRMHRGELLEGAEAVPERIARWHINAVQTAAKLAQDLGLDLTGRAKAVKDGVIADSLQQSMDLAALGHRGRKVSALRALPGR